MERGSLNTAGTTIDTPLVDAVRPARQDWTLDRRGNWSQTQEIRNGWTAPAQSRQANGKNEYTLLSQLVAPPDGVWNQVPEYDLAGNLLFEPRSPLSGNSSGDVDSLRYAYDEENRLIEVRRDQDNALLAKYAYDALGRRVQTLDYTASSASPCLNTSSPLITRHLMAGLQTLEETVHCTLAAGGSGDLLVREFVWGDRFPEPVAMVTHGGAAGGMGGPAVPAGDAVFYYLPDILGSVLALADAAGNVVELYSYDPYGRTAIERHETSGAWTATAASSFGNPFAWTGQRYDAPVRLYHFLFRSYSPTLGRWLQRDPAGYVDGPNLTEAMRSNPKDFVDPFGLLSMMAGPEAAGDAPSDDPGGPSSGCSKTHGESKPNEKVQWRVDSEVAKKGGNVNVHVTTRGGKSLKVYWDPVKKVFRDVKTGKEISKSLAKRLTGNKRLMRFIENAETRVKKEAGGVFKVSDGKFVTLLSGILFGLIVDHVKAANDFGASEHFRLLVKALDAGDLELADFHAERLRDELIDEGHYHPAMQWQDNWSKRIKPAIIEKMNEELRQDSNQKE